MLVETYFDTLTKDSSYFLGYIWADGSVTTNGKLRLGCVTSDEHVILNLGHELNSSFAIQRIPAYKRNGMNCQPYTTTTICSKRIVESLNNHGVVPRKSFLDCEYKEIPDELFPHFLRGYFDGDGSISTTKQGYHAVHLIGTRKFIAGMGRQLSRLTGLPQKELASNKRHSVYTLRYHSYDDILLFLDYIYPPGYYYYLERKRALSQQITSKIYDSCKLFGITRCSRRSDRWRVRLNTKAFGEFKELTDAITARNNIMETEYNNTNYTRLFPPN